MYYYDTIVKGGPPLQSKLFQIMMVIFKITVNHWGTWAPHTGLQRSRGGVVKFAAMTLKVGRVAENVEARRISLAQCTFHIGRPMHN